MTTRAIHRELPEQTDAILDSAMAPDNTHVAAAGANGKIVVWNLGSGIGEAVLTGRGLGARRGLHSRRPTCLDRTGRIGPSMGPDPGH